ncbi:DNA cytosine methyltransferase [Streptomyces sp. TLI_185]|uniref:DNA cytosine methyltransferase n=1 Tax=Streptomyces sp. TLI_185 TaxID=2485151 RepID=UPI0021A7B6BF|nr:DNA cytosine methyltransferase [Streptomyces sp. TLI_185]
MRGQSRRAFLGTPAVPSSQPCATRESAGLVLGTDTTPQELAVDDCYFRMLSPREHLRAQRFTDDYTVLGRGGEQTKQAGNAVPANVAQWIATALLEVL